MKRETRFVARAALVAAAATSPSMASETVVNNAITSQNVFISMSQERGLVHAKSSFAGLAEGEIGAAATNSDALLAPLGISITEGINPYWTIGGVTTGDTRIFIDRYPTFNNYGNIQFFARTNPYPDNVLRPVLVDVAGNPMSPNGRLETGYIHFDTDDNVYAFACEVMGTEVAYGTKFRFRFGEADSDFQDIVYFPPVSNAIDRKFYGFVFDQPISHVYIVLGAHWANDGAVMTSVSTGSLPPPPDPDPKPEPEPEPEPEPDPEPDPCPGDANANGVYDVGDITHAIFMLGSESTLSDIDQDEIVTTRDITALVFRLGSSCDPDPEPEPDPDPAPSADDPCADPPSSKKPVKGYPFPGPHPDAEEFPCPHG